VGEYEQIAVTVEAGVARIVLDRPDALNPLGLPMAREVHAALDAADAAPDVRAVVIGGAGRAFCSGADLASSDTPVTESGRPDVRSGLVEVYNPLILRLREIPLPVIAAVNGAAAGIGCSLALACDQIVAAESSYFLMAFANVGLTVDGGASAFLPARVGIGRASEMAMLAERVPAERALEWGLIDRVVADDALEDEAGALAARLASGATLSFASAKALFNSHAYPDLPAQLDREAEAQQRQAETDDFPIGVFAFLGKQQPEFKGR
jgi:2-(1,2-epoxy-1,2-dihydrophenyl)acetyl-CoA isomerase